MSLVMPMSQDPIDDTCGGIRSTWPLQKRHRTPPTNQYQVGNRDPDQIVTQMLQIFGRLLRKSFGGRSNRSARKYLSLHTAQYDLILAQNALRNRPANRHQVGFRYLVLTMRFQSIYNRIQCKNETKLRCHGIIPEPFRNISATSKVISNALEGSPAP